jgi:hypothetical protein
MRLYIYSCVYVYVCVCVRVLVRVRDPGSAWGIPKVRSRMCCGSYFGVGCHVYRGSRRCRRSRWCSSGPSVCVCVVVFRSPSLPRPPVPPPVPRVRPRRPLRPFLIPVHSSPPFCTLPVPMYLVSASFPLTPNPLRSFSPSWVGIPVEVRGVQLVRSLSGGWLRWYGYG